MYEFTHILILIISFPFKVIFFIGSSIDKALYKRTTSFDEIELTDSDKAYLKARRERFTNQNKNKTYK